MSEDTEPKRKRYIVQISFWLPESGPIQVFAKDEDHVRELVPKMLPHLKDVVIHDIMSEDELEHPEPPQNAPSTPVLN